jgi:type I restriction enzyme S subunit
VKAQGSAFAEAPRGWQRFQLRHIARLGSGHTPSRERPEYWQDARIPWITLGDVWQLRRERQKYIGETAERISELGVENSSAVVHPAGSVVLSRTASVGYPGIMARDMATSQDFAVWTCGPALNNEFLYYVLLGMRQEFERLMFGSTHKTIYMPDIEAIRIAVPDRDTQRAIVSCLDRETSRIDALIEKKTRFVEVLREKRQAVATEAVTKGLQRNAHMAESGVGWLGRVPSHWKRRRIATLFREVSRQGCTDLPVLSVSIHSGITDEELGDDDRDRKVSLIEDREQYKRVQPGDLTYNMMRAWQGAFGMAKVDGLVSPAYVVAEPTSPMVGDYFEMLLRTPMAIEEMRRYSRGITDFRMRLYWEAFRDLAVVVPPVEEQRQIVQNVRSALDPIAALEGKLRRSVDLLRERRAALITAAVTGQIDVRAEVPAEEPELA